MGRSVLDAVTTTETMLKVLYLTTVECREGHRRTFAHQDAWVPADQEAPWPDVAFCPLCREPYPDDLAVAITEVHEALIDHRTDIPPEDRRVAARGESHRIMKSMEFESNATEHRPSQ